MLIALAVVLIRSAGPDHWSAIQLVVLALLPVPMVQHAFGMLPFIGEAWTATAYLLGLLLAMHLGARWERAWPNQPLDALALGIALAGLLSVVIQLIQVWDVGGWWLSRTGDIGWRVFIVEFGGNRFSANIGQPNLLGTLLLWSLLSVAWGFQRRLIGGFTAVLLAMVLLWGLAITQSRTAWIGVAAIVIAVFWWRRYWRGHGVPSMVGLLGLAFAAGVVYFVRGVDFAVSADAWQVAAERLEAGLRPQAWLMFIDAALAKPWFGYGWSQVMVAHFDMADTHPSLFIVFHHAHNIVLDLMLWVGIPLGLLLLIFLLTWGIKKISRVSCAEQGIGVLFLVILGIHSMLEYPFSYAFFLFPAGVIAGSLDANSGDPRPLQTGRVGLVVLGSLAAILFAVIVRDYMGSIEQNFMAMRFEGARIGTATPMKAPDVLVLTHLREVLRLARYEVRAGISGQDARWVSDVARRNPSPGNLYKLAWILADTGKTIEASVVMLKAKRMLDAEHWGIVRRAWLNAAATNPKMKLVELPSPSGQN